MLVKAKQLQCAQKKTNMIKCGLMSNKKVIYALGNTV